MRLVVYLVVLSLQLKTPHGYSSLKGLFPIRSYSPKLPQNGWVVYLIYAS